jgi:hypothetical protein
MSSLSNLPRGSIQLACTKLERRSMPATGELIRMINYVDDMATTLRRITASVPFMTDDEKKRLAEHIRKFQPILEEAVSSLEKGSPR